MTPTLSIVIPAHDEGALIARTLRHTFDGATAGEFEVIVVANGCSDDTAHYAATAGAGIRVIEIAEASKIAALNAGDAAASILPRVYLDADVRIDVATLRALARVLGDSSTPRVAAPGMIVDSSRSSFAVRQFQRIWAESDYRRTAHVGSGIYAVNGAGRERWAAFPDVIADDRFVQQRFLPEERTTLSGHTFTIYAPKDMKTHVRRATRIEVGNQSLPREVQLATQDAAGSRYGKLLRRVARRPSLWFALPFYVYGYAVPRMRARRALRRGRSVSWSRDASSRTLVDA
ncbi:Glycosyltransferase involved in cell wall bisynthesis [Microbacterium sp. cf046]|uniref:glycosyltransferase n=1 Tax=Microbacterium sp. cf046 TaxID=1761803 RepID=UPI0008F21B04|nr:glycosyltransferase family 2 protein [Microbacterium sp. cf046]SFR88486.1 Glycosyltransferase involved in cell wall bisynthesis [Microbacterium sp. cf046]